MKKTDIRRIISFNKAASLMIVVVLCLVFSLNAEEKAVPEQPWIEEVVVKPAPPQPPQYNLWDFFSLKSVFVSKTSKQVGLITLDAVNLGVTLNRFQQWEADQPDLSHSGLVGHSGKTYNIDPFLGLAPSYREIMVVYSSKILCDLIIPLLLNDKWANWYMGIRAGWEIGCTTNGLFISRNLN